MTTRSLRVLVVDDERLIADSLAAIFRNSGFDVACAYSGYSAIQTAKCIEPDVMISDILMPGLNGVDAALSIYRHLPTLKFVFVSGCGGCQADLSAARNRGLSFIYLEKPVPPKFLVGYLEDCRRMLRLWNTAETANTSRPN